MITEPSLKLYQQVRGAFISKGSSLRAFCEKENITVQNVRQAVVGNWNGAKGKAVREKVVQAAFKEE